MVPDTHISFQKLGNEISQTTHKRLMSAPAWIFSLDNLITVFPLTNPREPRTKQQQSISSVSSNALPPIRFFYHQYLDFSPTVILTPTPEHIHHPTPCLSQSFILFQ
jgi:hypothetical protein